jgi:hypothetical protein
MIQKLRGKLTYANVMASVAVFLALGGGAYAATQLKKNSVGTKQLKNGAVTQQKISQSAQAALRGLTGPAGAAGQPGGKGANGVPPVTGWAEVKSDGSLGESSGFKSGNKTGTGLYEPVFDNESSKLCSFSLTLTEGADGGGSVIGGRGTFLNSLKVFTFNGAGAQHDEPFMIQVSC